MNKKNLIAAAISGLMFAASSCHLSNTTINSQGKTVSLGECHGVNACKGMGDCQGKGYSCSGKNECKGKGWKKMSKENCDAENGEFKEI